MTTIQLIKYINAPIEAVFDLSRNIDFHMQSASQTNEKTIHGVTSGLIKLNKTVTWRGRHFGFHLKHCSKIIEMISPHKFTDVMVEGHFNYFAHQHIFEIKDAGTLMIDILKYKTPYGIFGKLFDRVLLKNHLKKFLTHRNNQIKVSLEKISEA